MKKTPKLSHTFAKAPLSLSVLVVVLCFVPLCVTNADQIEIRMPNVTTQQEDGYICTMHKLRSQESYIINVDPLATADIVHHMFGYACEMPFETKSGSWNCRGGRECRGKQSRFFAWGRNAPALKMPDDVAFNVGKETGFVYIVVQIHYLLKVSNDHSGMTVTFSDQPRRFRAGILLLGTGTIEVPPRTQKYTTSFSCAYTGETLKAFAYRVHAHAHGVVNSAFKVVDNKWTPLAIGDPQWPQAFYPFDSIIDINDGDALVGACTYQNDEDRTIVAGDTHQDEMCNVYIMYYVSPLDEVMEECWENEFPELEKNIPIEGELRPQPPASFNYSGSKGGHEKITPQQRYHHHQAMPTNYTFVADWYNTSEVSLGQVGGVAINPVTDKLTIFHRASRTWMDDSFTDRNVFNTRRYPVIDQDTIQVLDRATGKAVDSWGANLFYMPHGLKVDAAGNVWVTDVALHQVLKFSPDNKLQPLLEVGEKLVPGNDRTHLCQPSDVAVLSTGEFFVADGYCNSRIVKFSKGGEYLTEWSSNVANTPTNFVIPHSLALHEEKGVLCVADRENFRIKCFDLQGNLLHQTDSDEFGPIYAVAFAANEPQVLYAVNGLNLREPKQYDKKVLLVSAQSGGVKASIDLKGHLGWPHALCLTEDASEIYIADLKPPAVVKFTLDTESTILELTNFDEKNAKEFLEELTKLKQLSEDKTELKTLLLKNKAATTPLRQNDKSDVKLTAANIAAKIASKMHLAHSNG